MPDISELFRAPTPRISHEGQIARLREYAERLKQPCPFAVGDLVTPRRGVAVRDVGEPHLVLEVLATPLTNLGNDPAIDSFAEIRDVKVASITHGHETAFLMWSGDFEPYRGERADA